MSISDQLLSQLRGWERAKLLPRGWRRHAAEELGLHPTYVGKIISGRYPTSKQVTRVHEYARRRLLGRGT